MFPSSYFDSPMLTIAMETHIKSLKEGRFAFLDNGDESMTSTSLPNYQKNRKLLIEHSLKLSPIRRMPLHLLHLPPLLWRSQVVQLLLNFLLTWKLY